MQIKSHNFNTYYLIMYSTPSAHSPPSPPQSYPPRRTSVQVRSPPQRKAFSQLTGGFLLLGMFTVYLEIPTLDAGLHRAIQRKVKRIYSLRRALGANTIAVRLSLQLTQFTWNWVLFIGPDWVRWGASVGATLVVAHPWKEDDQGRPRGPRPTGERSE